MKGQSSVETLVTLGMVLAFTIPVLLLLLVASQYGTENSSIYQAQVSSHMVADVMNDVYIQGNGAERQILINLPGNADSIEVTSEGDSGGEVIISLSVSGGKYAAVSPTFAKQVSGSPTSGQFYTADAKGLIPLRIRNINGAVEVSVNG